jgi:hypothetical protein
MLTVGLRARNSRMGPGVIGMVMAVGLFPAAGTAQVTWQDLVFTGGLSAEGYRGNLSAVTVPAVDSTDHASAVVGEMSGRGSLSLFARQQKSLALRLDAGLRQFAAGGFKVRDYAPREWVGQVDLAYRQELERRGILWIEAGTEGRRVEDRPPMPLFIQPGYLTVDGQVRLQAYPVRGVSFDAEVSGELADYRTSALTPQLDLLDRRGVGLQVGASWGPSWNVRVHLGARATDYENQGTFDPSDPYRKDRSLSLGAQWTSASGSGYLAQVGLEGTLNRSNSNRPEYNALRLQAVLSAPLRSAWSLNFFGALTVKDYLTRTDFARLVPGEEAENASQIYLELARPLMVNLDGALRFGWTRAETEIGDAYFRRYATSLLLRYRPWAR